MAEMRDATNRALLGQRKKVTYPLKKLGRCWFLSGGKTDPLSGSHEEGKHRGENWGGDRERGRFSALRNLQGGRRKESNWGGGGTACLCVGGGGSPYRGTRPPGNSQATFFVHGKTRVRVIKKRGWGRKKKGEGNLFLGVRMRTLRAGAATTSFGRGQRQIRGLQKGNLTSSEQHRGLPVWVQVRKAQNLQRTENKEGQGRYF